MTDDQAKQYLNKLWNLPPKCNPQHPMCVEYFAALQAFLNAINDRAALVKGLEEGDVQYAANVARKHMAGEP